MSDKPNLKKLLRTLSQYNAKRLLVPTGQSPRILRGEEWTIIEEHPKADETTLMKYLKEELSEEQTAKLLEEERIDFEHQSDRFCLHWQAHFEGGTLVVERQEPLPELTEKLHDKGVLILEDSGEYYQFLREWTRKKTGNALSLERQVSHQIDSVLGLLIQKEWERSFLEVEEGLRSLDDYQAQCLAVKELPLTVEETRFIERFANKHPVVIMPDPLASPPPFKQELLFRE